MTAQLRITSNSADETQSIGRIIGANANPGDLFLLTGPLGAGKTCLTQGIAWGLDVKERPRSPTFVLLARYRGRVTIHHADLFRIEGTADALSLGLEDCLNDDDVCIVEWADRAPELFIEPSLRIEMNHRPAENDTRTITLQTDHPRYHPILTALTNLKTSPPSIPRRGAPCGRPLSPSSPSTGQTDPKTSSPSMGEADSKTSSPLTGED